MNEKFKQRLVGLIVVLALLFGLSWLLPRQTGGADRDVPSTVVPLSTVPVGRSGSSGIAESSDGSRTDELGDAEGAPQIPPEERVPPREWGKRRTNATDQTTTTTDTELGANKLVPSPAISTDKPHSSALAELKPKPSPPAMPATVNPTKLVPPPVIAADTDRLQPFPSAASTSSSTPPKPPSPPSASKPAVAAPLSQPAASLSPPVSVSAADSPDAKTWYVQIGSFADQNNAQTSLSLLQNIGYRGESSPITNASGNRLYRVRLGPFPNEAAARAAQEKIAHQGYPQSRAVAENSNGR